MAGKIIYPEDVIKIAQAFRNHGYSAYAVGGCVRDSIMGRVPSDWDMTTDATPEQMIEIFTTAGLRFVPTGLKHGTITVIIGKKPYECTTFRIDGSYTDSRRPDKVEFSRDISEDLCRRDFTVNAMAADPLVSGNDSAIVDLFSGQEDIERKIIRCVGDPERRFTEDALRILRCIRFATVLGFEIEENTLAAAKSLAPRLENISAERKSVELEKILLSDGAERGVDLLLSTGVAKYIHPEIKKNSFEIQGLPKSFSVRLASLLLGEGKPQLSSMKLSNEIKDQTSLLASDGLYREYSRQFDSDECANARYMIAKYGPLAPCAALLRGDDNLARLIESEMAKHPAVTIAALEIDGNKLLSLGIEAKKLGKIMTKLLMAVIKEPSANRYETLCGLALEFNKEI